jgi:hypothetical protein
MLRFKQYFLFNEGVHDPGIFHAVFMAGGPGSGKDYVMSRTLHGHGLREINSDIAFEHALKKHKLSPLMPESEKEKRDVLRSGAKETTQKMQNLSQEGRNGLIINGTGADPEKYDKIKNHLESLGYKTHMVFVHTKNEVSNRRNIERGQRGGRTVPEDVRQQSWNDVQNAKEHYKKMFGNNYHEVDNSIDTRHAPDELRNTHENRLNQVFKHFRKETASKQRTPEAEKWIQSKLKK